ncbi:MAG: PEP-CTERM sorting domain-containing protein [Acetobacteraceae bacterium]
MRGFDTLIFVSLATAGVIQVVSIAGQPLQAGFSPTPLSPVCCHYQASPSGTPLWSIPVDLHAPSPPFRLVRSPDLALTLELDAVKLADRFIADAAFSDGKAVLAARYWPIALTDVTSPTDVDAQSADDQPSLGAAWGVFADFSSNGPDNPGGRDDGSHGLVPIGPSTGGLTSGPDNPGLSRIAFTPTPSFGSQTVQFVPPIGTGGPPGTITGPKGPTDGPPGPVVDPPDSGPILGPPPSGDFGVPEPSALGVLAAALFGLALSRRARAG